MKDTSEITGQTLATDPVCGMSVDPGTAALGLVIDRGVASGEFQAAGIRNFPQILVGPTVLAVVWMLVLGECHGLDLDAYREAHIDFVLRGLRGVDSAVSPQDTEPLHAGDAS